MRKKSWGAQVGHKKHELGKVEKGEGKERGEVVFGFKSFI